MATTIVGLLPMTWMISAAILFLSMVSPVSPLDGGTSAAWAHTAPPDRVAGRLVQEHDHDNDGNNSGIIAYAGKLHPVAVHFPIALIILAGFAELLSIVRRRDDYAFAARFLIYAGAATAIVTASLGLAAASATSYTGANASNFAVHRVLGLVVPVLAALAAGLAANANRTRRSAPRALYRAVLFVAVICAALAGHFGGLLVHGPEHFRF